MADIDVLLALGVVAAVSINALTNYYLIRRLPPPSTISPAKTEKEDEVGEDEEEKESDKEEAASGEPSKEQILARRAQLIREIEQERGTKVITLIHRKEPWSKGDDEPEIVIEESEIILQQVRQSPPDQPIDLILHTPGGLAFAAQTMAMALKFHKAKVTVMIPFYALSNGTLLALAGDEIMMEKYSVLGPVEPQIDDMPATAIMSTINRKPIELVSDRMILLADRARMENDNAKGFIRWLLDDKMTAEQAEQVANFLTGGFMSASTPITLDVTRAMGLKVTEGVPEKVYQLFGTMEFSGQRPGKQFT